MFIWVDRAPTRPSFSLQPLLYTAAVVNPEACMFQARNFSPQLTLPQS